MLQQCAATFLRRLRLIVLRYPLSSSLSAAVKDERTRAQYIRYRTRLLTMVVLCSCARESGGAFEDGETT